MHHVKKIWYLFTALLILYGILGILYKLELLGPIEHLYQIIKLPAGAGLIFFILILGKFSNFTWTELIKERKNRLLFILLCTGLTAAFVKILMA